jgi:hypothetical protein
MHYPPILVVVHTETQTVHTIQVNLIGMKQERMKKIGQALLAEIKYQSSAADIHVGEFASGQLWEDLWISSLKDGDKKYGENFYRRTTCILGGMGIGQGCPFTSFKRVA